MKTIITTPDAPAPAAPYAQGTEAGGLVFASGRLPARPDGSLIGREDMRGAAALAMTNMLAVLRAGGCELRDVLKVTVFLTDMADFPAMNGAWSELFGANPPARSCVQVAALPRGAVIETEGIGYAGAPGIHVRNL